MLFVGGSMYAKRSDAVRALAILSKKYDNVRVIIDTLREQEMLSALSEQLGVKDRLLLLNSRSDAELSEVYAACDVFVYPSSAGTWGLVVTEAMAAGKPVILSKQVGTAEIVTDQVNGIIVDQTTPQVLAQQVEKLLNDPKLCNKIGTNAYLNVKNNLSWEKYAKTVESIFQETLNAKKS
jgi:glycosyltransferase involved in cell wall biosynthesis